MKLLQCTLATSLFALAASTLLAKPADAAIINVSAGSLTQCPAVGAAGSCAAVYRFNANGSVDTLVDSSVPSTDNIEDTLVGVLNNSGHSLDFLTLSGKGTSSIPIFAFDGDGQSTVANPGSGPGDTYFGHYSDAAGSVLGTTYFTNINPFQDTGDVNFPGLPDGGSGWWVLEDQISFQAPPTVSGSVPEPTTMALLGLGLAGMGWMRRQKK